jgi:hypothetical protein
VTGQRDLQTIEALEALVRLRTRGEDRYSAHPLSENRIAARSRCTVQVCTMLCGQVASIASGNPLSPSQHRGCAARHTFRPRTSPLGGLHPDPEHVLGAVEVDPMARCAASRRIGEIASLVDHFACGLICLVVIA